MESGDKRKEGWADDVTDKAVGVPDDLKTPKGVPGLRASTPSIVSWLVAQPSACISSVTMFY